MISSDYYRRFGGLARLYGEQGLSRLRSAHAVVIGVGGVGSWAVEALARSGIGELTLIDMDHIAESNINRQLHALSATLGMSKIEAMRERILAINPEAKVNLVDDWITPDNIASVVPQNARVIVDAIDQPRAKAALIAWAKKSCVPVLVCGAAGGRTHATSFAVTDVALVKGDALIASVRGRLRRDYSYSRVPLAAFGVMAIHSTEIPVSTKNSSQTPVDGSLNCAGYGSVVTVTATMGFVAADQAMKIILK